MTLAHNHLRVLSAALTIVEKNADEIASVLRNPVNETMYSIDQTLSSEQIHHILSMVTIIKQRIAVLSKKYHCTCEITDQKIIVQTIKFGIWEALHDSFSHALRGYGIMSESDALEFDNDIQSLVDVAEQILPTFYKSP
jgi:hypothetical protein